MDQTPDVHVPISWRMTSRRILRTLIIVEKRPSGAGHFWCTSRGAGTQETGSNACGDLIVPAFPMKHGLTATLPCTFFHVPSALRLRLSRIFRNYLFSCGSCLSWLDPLLSFFFS